MTPHPPQVRVAATGDYAERYKTIPIKRPADRTRMVVISLGPGSDPDLSLPDLRPGDRLWVGAELEVTTDVEPGQKGLIGRRAYRYAPEVEARLLLAKHATTTERRSGRARELAADRQTVSHRKHHHVVVFVGAEYVIPSSGLGWRGRSYLNLALSATSRFAKPGNVLLVGQNDQNPATGRWRVGQDMGQLSVVRLRPATQSAPVEAGAAVRIATRIPIRTSKRTVVYSRPLEGLEKGEQLAVTARLWVSAAHLGYAARISTRLFLAESETQEEPGGWSRDGASFRGRVTKLNGFNCVPETGGTGRPAKVGVLRMLKTPRRRLYLNLVAVGGDPETRAKAGDELKVLDGAIEVTRYPPELEG